MITSRLTPRQKALIATYGFTDLDDYNGLEEWWALPNPEPFDKFGSVKAWLLVTREGPKRYRVCPNVSPALYSPYRTSLRQCLADYTTWLLTEEF